jgi:serine/threonine protein kinase
VLSDFGIAKTFDDGTLMTAAGWTMGTPSYMSPEQAMGRPVDARSDLYSLGVVFYEMLTGAKPYKSTDFFAIALMHVNSPVPRLPDKLARYQGIIDKLLAKDPRDRFSSAEELIKALDDLDTTALASPASPDEEVTRVTPLPLRPVPKYSLGLLGFISLVLMASIAYLFWPKPLIHTKPESPQEQSPDTPKSLPLDPKTRLQMEAFLENARFNFEVGYLIYPYGTNAAHSYCQVLSLDPRNAEASKGLSAVADAYTKIPDDQVDQDELADSLKLIEDCLTYTLGHPGLLALQDRIKQQLSRVAGH